MVEKKNKILIVGMPESIHLARWINNIDKTLYDVHLFPSKDLGYVHPALNNITVHHAFFWKGFTVGSNIVQRGMGFSSRLVFSVLRFVTQNKNPKYRHKLLAKVINKIKPDIIHSLEMQEAGYYVLDVKKQYFTNSEFPKWIVTNWGSDIFLFARLKNHKDKVIELLKNADFYSCECERDAKLAKEYGFSNAILPVFPNTGGLDLSFCDDVLASAKQTHLRKAIIVKGYQHFAGRAIESLEAIRMCSDILTNHTIYIFSADYAVLIASELLINETGLDIKVIPSGTNHDEILKVYAQCRVFLAMSISDAISTSFLEAMAMGCFPIQTSTACIDEWGENGTNFFALDSCDKYEAAKLLRVAVLDDDLVLNASKLNYDIVKLKYNKDIIREKIKDFYKKAIKS